MRTATLSFSKGPNGSYRSEFRSGRSRITKIIDAGQIERVRSAAETIYGKGSLATTLLDSPELAELALLLRALIEEEPGELGLGSAPTAPLALTVDAVEPFLSLPWELIGIGESSRVSVEPYRVVSGPNQERRSVRNRPLRVLFMASSPEEIGPVLSFENEEALILENTEDIGAEIRVEESGTLDGLRTMLNAHPQSHFDVLHLSGHARVATRGPVFLFEDDTGRPVPATANDIAATIGRSWPTLVFLSGCQTGERADGDVPSMAESLVRSGAPAVLGWALPVGESAASYLAGVLYGSLAAGADLRSAVASARRDLAQAGSPHWHLLRLYGSAEIPKALVTVPGRPGRAVIERREIVAQFLDPALGRNRVAGLEDFVGRRRPIQRCLRALTEPTTSETATEVLVLHGMGGLGKSTLARRLVERLPTHRSAVWFGSMGEEPFRRLGAKLGQGDDGSELGEVLNRPGIDLESRIGAALTGPLADQPCLFVFDDFENGNLTRHDDGYRCTDEATDLIKAVANGIRGADSASRLIITSRYLWELPAEVRCHRESLESFSRTETAKRAAGLALDYPSAATSPLRQRAIDAASGNPRLLEWLYAVIEDSAGAEDLVAALEKTEARFRTDTAARKLVEAQPWPVRRLLAQVNVVRLPVPLETVATIAAREDIVDQLQQAARFGLVEIGIEPTTGADRYLVSNVLAPVLDGVLSHDEFTAACSAAARSLNDIWLPGADE